MAFLALKVITLNRTIIAKGTPFEDSFDMHLSHRADGFFEILANFNLTEYILRIGISV